MFELENAIQALLNKGEIKQEDIDHARQRAKAKSVVKADMNNLGGTVVDLLIKIDELEQRIVTLEGGTTNA